MSCTQFDLFGHPIEERKPQSELAVLDFEGHAVRVVMIKDQPWWILSDVARVLGYRDAGNAGRPLREKEKGTHQMSTLGGDQSFVVISEAGLYRLIMKSERPEAERFQDWVCEEVLPAIRRTGAYSLRSRDAVTREAKRLKCDPDTARARLRLKDKNRAFNSIKAANGSTPVEFRRAHNAAYMGQFGMDCAHFRKVLDLKKGQTPLDRMSMLCLSQREHAIALACKMEQHRGLTQGQKLQEMERCSRKLAQNDLQLFGPGSQYGIVDDGRRGRIIDLIIPQLATA